MAPVPNPYDELAATYAAHNDGGVWNARYERPATLRLLGPVDGLRVLDAGCGAGATAAAIVAAGGLVTGFDGSAGILDLAKARLGDGVDLRHHDLLDPLPYPDAAFDAVVASLVLHYLEHWRPALAELRRVTRPGGRFVVSTHHPFMDHDLAGGDDYFATYAFTEEWATADGAVTMRFWHRPLHAMVEAFQATGWTIARVEEPVPDPTVAEAFPDEYRVLTTRPRFLFFALQAS